MKKLLLTAIFAAPLLVAMPAMAQDGPDGPGRGEEKFAEMDLNGDGIITRGETAEKRNQLFAEADINGDGLISYDEGIAAHQAKMAEKGWEGRRHKGAAGKFFAHQDIDGDGFVSQEEAEVMSNKHFTRMDANLDGAVTLLEAKAAFKDHMGRRLKDQH